MRRSSALLIDLYIPRDAPLSDFFERFPRLAASAAPAAICCFLDFAGIKRFRPMARERIHQYVSASLETVAQSTQFEYPHWILAATNLN
jgi:hypothetical protein